jgi:hypothetical protein
MALTALNLLTGERPLAFSGALELGDNHRLIELGDGAEYLPDQLGRGCVV